MKKQLSMADIEPLITKLEQTYSNSAHAVNALGEKPFNEMSDQTIELLGFVLYPLASLVKYSQANYS